MTIRKQDRFTVKRPCPICGGGKDAPHGKGVRCFGFKSSDGVYAHCTREECAGELSHNSTSSTFAHILDGACRCGLEHQPSSRITSINKFKVVRGEPIAQYDYRNKGGSLVYQVVRYQPKQFKVRRPGKNNSWLWNLKGVELIPYRLTEVLSAESDEWIFITEGEKDADQLIAQGLIATTNTYGAEKWRKSYNKHFTDRRLAILPDNDSAGQKHAESVAQHLHGIARALKVIKLPKLSEKGDVSDWFHNGHTREELLDLVNISADYESPIANANS